MLALALLLLTEATRSPQPETVVRAFYDRIIKYHPIGVPEGAAKKALWPFLSARVRKQLAAGQDCEQDYYRQHRDVPGADQLKPEFGWLEDGLFSGANEMALPVAVNVTKVEPLRDGQYRVGITFTYRDTFATYGRPPDDSNTFSWSGTVYVISEAGQYVLDAFLIKDPEDQKERRTLEFSGCQGGRWVGFKEQQP